MNIQDDYRYPYPVLSQLTDDYLDSEFTLSIKIKENPKNEAVKISYEVTFTSSSLMHQVENGAAVLGIFIVSDRVYYNKFHAIDSLVGDIKFSKGELLGNVSFRAIVCAKTKIDSYSCRDINEEFSTKSWTFEAGAILGYSEKLVSNIGLDKLSKFESIFNFELGEDVSIGQVKVNLDSEKIAVVLNPDDESRFSAIRASSNGKSVLLGSVYLAVVMETLMEIEADRERFEGKSWYKVFSAKCDFIGVDLDNVRPLADAQKLLSSPFKRVFDLDLEG